jgi:hypothetical protein
MAEELRFFLRPALFTLVLAPIYWFASYDASRDTYDWAGTVMLAFVAFATAAYVSFVWVTTRSAHGEVAAPQGRLTGRVAHLAGRIVGFDDPPAEQEAPMSHAPDAAATRSAWPLVAGFGATLVLLGLVFGAWLLVPGIGLAAVASWGALRQLERR